MGQRVRQTRPRRAIRSASMPSSCLAMAAWAGRRWAVGMFSAAVTAADRSLRRSVMAATNCFVSASFGFFSATSAQRLFGARDPRRQFGAVAGELADLAQRDTEPIGPALVDQTACGDRGAVHQRYDDRREQPRYRQQPANLGGGEQLTLAGGFQLHLGDLQCGPVAVALGLQLSLERVGLGLVVGLDSDAFRSWRPVAPRAWPSP